ncbi:MAG: hypothetical protein DMF88_05810 [Acidobacteria bacterium]|nr:MAG: hypothetical protein DMF88_05810 [Acidobacteriota bacterium]
MDGRLTRRSAAGRGCAGHGSAAAGRPQGPQLHSEQPHRPEAAGRRLLSAHRRPVPGQRACRRRRVSPPSRLGVCRRVGRDLDQSVSRRRRDARLDQYGPLRRLEQADVPQQHAGRLLRSRHRHDRRDARRLRHSQHRSLDARGCEIFTDATAPGLAEQPDFVHDSVFAEVDSRDAHGFPRRGGFYRAAYALWNDRTLEQYNFRRFDVVGSHFLSVAANDVIALRLGLSYANNASGNRVPFYLLPYVGGGDTIRSFREFRFRDENAGIFNAEFRHKIHSMAHVAGFVDFGKVAHDWQDINPSNVVHAYGVGLRGGTDERTYLRFDVAWGDRGTRVFLKFTPAF